MKSTATRNTGMLEGHSTTAFWQNKPKVVGVFSVKILVPQLQHFVSEELDTIHLNLPSGLANNIEYQTFVLGNPSTRTPSAN
jgi:hypothetical protein